MTTASARARVARPPEVTAAELSAAARRVRSGTRRGPDTGILSGIAIAVFALVVGVAATGVSARYFLQPTGILIVLGGTVGVMMITTPFPSLTAAMQRAGSLFSKPPSPDRAKLLDEIVSYAKVVRIQGLLAIEQDIDAMNPGFLKEALLMALDAKDRNELQSSLENKIRFSERQSDASAKVFEVAGGFAPTIGVLGTVVGLIDILRQFSSLNAVAAGVGAAFTSTIYGLALANLILLPAAHRIRSSAAEKFELHAMMMEGAICLFDGTHPRLVRQRLLSFLQNTNEEISAVQPFEPVTVSE